MRFKTAIAVSLAVSCVSATAAEVPVLVVGRPAPELELPATDGSPRSLASTEGPTGPSFSDHR